MTSSIIIAKAQHASEQSDSIVVSFSADWKAALYESRFTAVIRKRIPKTICPRWLYFHINSPVGGIAGRAKIDSCGDVTVEKLGGMTQDLALSLDDILSYLDGSSTIGCYELSEIELLKEPLMVKELLNFKYHAPQSFFILSKRGKSRIDEAAGFKEQ